MHVSKAGICRGRVGDYRVRSVSFPGISQPTSATAVVYKVNNSCAMGMCQLIITQLQGCSICCVASPTENRDSARRHYSDGIGWEGKGRGVLNVQ